MFIIKMPIELIFMTFSRSRTIKIRPFSYIQVFQDHKNPNSLKIKEAFEWVNQDKEDCDIVFKVLILVLSNFKSF